MSDRTTVPAGVTPDDTADTPGADPGDAPPEAPAVHRVRVGDADAGRRVDQVLAAALPQLSRSRVQALIRDGRLSDGDATLADPAMRVKAGQELRLEVPSAAPARPQAQALGLDVVYEDDQLIVIDKPAGLVVHPAPGNPDGTLVNALIAHCGDSLQGIGGEKRPGIVHRLDKDTSGLMVAAKTEPAHAGLVAQFAERRIDRRYLALVWGVPAPAQGRLTGAIGRAPRDRKKMAVVAQGGRPAATNYRTRQVLAEGAVSLLDCRLETGRTHQIRVHLSEAGHPLLGDPVYGRGRRRALDRLPPAARGAVAGLERQALHAARLGFAHPLSGRAMRFERGLPADLADLVAALGGRAEET
jgi:23S rRNA pseudouridine1911/1915/1917 synthase